MNQITRPRLVAHALRDPMVAITARLEDLPPPLCAWASLTLRTATSDQTAYQWNSSMTTRFNNSVQR